MWKTSIGNFSSGHWQYDLLSFALCCVAKVAYVQVIHLSFRWIIAMSLCFDKSFMSRGLSKSTCVSIYLTFFAPWKKLFCLNILVIVLSCGPSSESRAPKLIKNDFCKPLFLGGFWCWVGCPFYTRTLPNGYGTGAKELLLDFISINLCYKKACEYMPAS